MTDQKIDLTTGGFVVVLVGTTGYVKEYEQNPQVRFLKCAEIPNGEMSQHVPDNTRVIIMTEGIPQYHYMWATSYVRTKGIFYLVKKSNQAIYETLKSFFVNGLTSVRASPDEVKDALSRGKLTPLIPLINFTISNAENGRALMRECLKRGIKTTEGSLTQFVAIQRRKTSGTGVPASARPKLDVSVELLDDMIKQLGDMRGFLIATCEENRILKTKVERFKKVMEDG